MKVIGRPKLVALFAVHPECRIPLQCWLAEVEESSWESMDQVRARYRDAQSAGDADVTFRFLAGQCALQARINFKLQLLLVQQVSASIDVHVQGH